MLTYIVIRVLFYTGTVTMCHVYLSACSNPADIHVNEDLMKLIIPKSIFDSNRREYHLIVNASDGNTNIYYTSIARSSYVYTELAWCNFKIHME